MFRDEASHFFNERGIEDGGAVFLVKNGERDTPSPLAGDAPIRARFHGAADAVAPPMRNPICVVHGGEGIRANGVDADKELFDGAENDGALRAPAVGVRVGVIFYFDESGFFRQEGNDIRVGGKNIFADEGRDSAFFGEAAIVVHGREERKAVLYAEVVVVVAVSGSDMDESCARFEGYEIGCVDGRRAVEERVASRRANQVGTREFL